MSTKKIQLLDGLDFVHYNKEQKLTDEQKVQVRKNINAGEPQIQVDWNQSDPTAKDFVRNRPCYEDEIEEVFERTLYGTEYLVDAEFCENLWKNRYTATFVVNGVKCPYNIFNDKVTETYRSIRLNVPGATAIQSHGIAWHKSSGSDVFDKIFFTSSFFNKKERENATTTISFSLKTKILRELDEKFIPDSIARIKDINEAMSTDDEIIDMLIEEDMLIAITDSDGSILVDENENILTW